MCINAVGIAQAATAPRALCYPMAVLTISSVTVRLGGRPILDQASAAIPPKSRVGLVGRNGSGKSTLLRVIAGTLHPDEGAVAFPRGLRLGYLEQEAPSGPANPFDTVLAADAERTALLVDAERPHDPERLAEIHERLSAIDAHSAPGRVARILNGIGFTDAMQRQPLDSLSGGWRMRVALAALLFSAPDFLLLDEPSNHLDLEASIWLEEYLRSYRGTLLIVSHERDLLNNVVDHILHLDQGKLLLYAGGYDQFESQRRERQAHVAAMRERQEARRKKLQAFVDRWRYKAHAAAQAQSRIKALARLQPIAEAADDPTLSFEFPNPDELRPPLVTLSDVALGYVPGSPVLSHVTMRFDPDDRLALLGRNGNGKTTLARLLAGELPALSGVVNANSKLRVAYFSQLQADQLIPGDTPVQHLARLLPAARPAEVRAQLARFGFSGDKAEVLVRHLSGGEKARLALALITRFAPHMVILDEPTNHLDVDAREALVQGLNEYTGAVVVVSHDRHLLELVADRLILVADGAATEFTSTLDDYRQQLLSRDRGEVGDGRKDVAPSRKDERRAAADLRQRTQGLRNELKTAERELARVTAQRDQVALALADPKQYGPSANVNALTVLLKNKSELDRVLAAAEERWLAAAEALEIAESGGK